MSPAAYSGRNERVKTSELRLMLRRCTRRGRRSAPTLPRRKEFSLKTDPAVLFSLAMKFVLACLIYLIIGLVLGFGIFLAVKGSLWFLILGFVAYILLFAKIGCLHH